LVWGKKPFAVELDCLKTLQKYQKFKYQNYQEVNIFIKCTVMQQHQPKFTMFSIFILLFRLQSDHALKLLITKLEFSWCWNWTVKHRNTAPVYKTTLKAFRLIQRSSFFFTLLSLYCSKIFPQRNYPKRIRVLRAVIPIVLHFTLSLPVTY